MRKLIPLLTLIVLAACGEKGSSEKARSENILENLTYSVDTLEVDSKGEIINLKYGMNWFDLSPDSKSLFIYDNDRTLFQEIDLSQMVLINAYPFEKEGPNGIGRPTSFQVLANKTMMIPTYANPGIFTLSGEQIRPFNLKPNDLTGSELTNGFAILSEMIWDSKSEKLISLPGDITSGVFELAVTNPNSQTVQMLQLPKMEMAKNFRVTQIEGEGGAAFTEVYRLLDLHDKILISCSVRSGIYLFDPKTDSLDFIDFSHQIISNEKSGEIKNDVSSQQEWYEEYKKVVSQVTYWKMNWDESTSRFYRLASRSILGESRQDPASFKVYLLIYDEKLNLLGESLIEGFNQFPSSYFFKDGKLYSYVNVEDELGFAVFTFDF
jgi:hypothetical protein